MNPEELQTGPETMPEPADGDAKATFDKMLTSAQETVAADQPQETNEGKNAGMLGDMVRERSAFIKELNAKVEEVNALAPRISELEKSGKRMLSEYTSIVTDHSLDYDERNVKLAELDKKMNVASSERKEKFIRYSKLMEDINRARKMNL